MPTIVLQDVSGVYRDGTTGLHPTTLEIPAGELVVIVGPSGSGKSTLVRLIAGLERPATGRITFDDEVMNEVPSSSRGVGLVVTQGALYEHMTSEDNLRFPLKVTGVDEPEQTERTRAEAGRFGIRRLLDRKPRTLSAGERQLVATGRATVRDTSVLLFDEALAGIDPHLREQVRKEFRRLHDGSHTIVYATNEQEEAMRLADRLIVLDRGHVQQVGPPLEVYQRPATTFVGEFIGHPGMNILPADGTPAGRLRIGEDELDCPTPLPSVPFLLGIRPEHVALARPGHPFRQTLHARVTAIENLGSDRICHVAFGTPESGAVDFRVRLTEGRPLASGDRVELAVGLDKVSFFERASGVRIEGTVTPG
jgi:sn-glycerol 3-phosphate transport system ATP-binding protein